MRHFICNELEPLAYLIFALVLYLEYRRKGLKRHGVLFLFYVFATLLIFGGIVITSVLNGWSYNILFLTNIIVFSWYFYTLLQSRLQRKIVLICAAINVILLIYSYLSRSFVDSFNGYAYGVSFITIVIYCLFYFYRLLGNVTEENLLLNFDFWLICSYLFYFIGSFFIVIYYEHVDIMIRAEVWGIQNIILFFCSLVMLCIHILIVKKEKALHE